MSSSNFTRYFGSSLVNRGYPVLLSLSLSVPVLFLLYLEGHEEQHGGHKRVQSFSSTGGWFIQDQISRSAGADLKLIQEEQEESRRVAEAKKESLEQEKKRGAGVGRRRLTGRLPRLLTEAEHEKG